MDDSSGTSESIGLRLKCTAAAKGSPRCSGRHWRVQPCNYRVQKAPRHRSTTLDFILRLSSVHELGGQGKFSSPESKAISQLGSRICKSAPIQSSRDSTQLLVQVRPWAANASSDSPLTQQQQSCRKALKFFVFQWKRRSCRVSTIGRNRELS